MTNTAQDARCQGCGHRIWSAASISRGYSERCWRKARIAAIETAIAGYSERQQEKALDLMASGRLRPASRPGTWLAGSSDGTATYLVQADSCTCPARKRCCHQAARAGAMAVLALTQSRPIQAKKAA